MVNISNKDEAYEALTDLIAEMYDYMDEHFNLDLADHEFIVEEENDEYVTLTLHFAFDKQKQC